MVVLKPKVVWKYSKLEVSWTKEMCCDAQREKNEKNIHLNQNKNDRYMHKC